MSDNKIDDKLRQPNRKKCAEGEYKKYKKGSQPQCVEKKRNYPKKRCPKGTNKYENECLTQSEIYFKPKKKIGRPRNCKDGERRVFRKNSEGKKVASCKPPSEIRKYNKIKLNKKQKETVIDQVLTEKNLKFN